MRYFYSSFIACSKCSYWISTLAAIAAFVVQCVILVLFGNTLGDLFISSWVAWAVEAQAFTELGWWPWHPDRRPDRAPQGHVGFQLIIGQTAISMLVFLVTCLPFKSPGSLHVCASQGAEKLVYRFSSRDVGFLKINIIFS